MRHNFLQMDRRIVIVLGSAALLLCLAFLGILSSQVMDRHGVDLAHRKATRHGSPQLNPVVATSTPVFRPESPPIPPSTRAAAVLHVPVIMFHQIRPTPGHLTRSQKLMTIAPETFKSQMKDMVEAGYRTITPDELREALVDGTPLPEKPVLLTFDDGYRGQYEYAFPVLKEYGLNATLFVISNYLDGGKHGFFDRKMLLEMDASGLITVGSHTKNHAWLAALPPDKLADEVKGSKHDLESIVGHPVTAFAYPYGKYDPSAIQAVKDAGYGIAFGAYIGDGHTSSTILELHRIRMEEGKAILPVLERYSR